MKEVARDMTQVAIVSSAPNGGAGIAASRLWDALRLRRGLTVDFIDRAALGEDVPTETIPPGSFSNRTISDTHYTVEHPGYWRGWLIELLAGYDLINIHWATTIISSTELFALAKTGASIVLTMHDLNYVTGGCHYPASCNLLAHGCYSCPQIDRSLTSQAIPPKILDIKRRIFQMPNVALSAPSRYVRDLAVDSGIVPPERAHVMRNAYQPLTPPVPARDPGKITLLLIADSLHERRKNMRLALESLKLIGARVAIDPTLPNVVVELVGEGDAEIQTQVAATGLKTLSHGRISDHAVLVSIYERSDIVLTCSSEDNWPNILVEAGAYGCAAVVGPGHGCEEFVSAFDFGAIAASYSANDFADAVLTAIARRSTEDSARGISMIRDAHDPGLIAREFERTFLRPSDQHQFAVGR